VWGCGRHACRCLAVGTQVHKTDFTQRRTTHDVHRPEELAAVDACLLVLLDELELFDGRGNGGLPGEAIAGRNDDLLCSGRVAGNDASGDQLAVFDADGVRVPHAALHVVTEADRPALGGD